MFRIMTHYLKAYKWQVLALMVFQIAQALLALYLPNLNRHSSPTQTCCRTNSSFPV